MLKIYKSGAPRIRQAIPEIDMVESEDHSLKLDLTDQPIEDGSSVNDHAIFDQRVLKITVWSSPTPGTAKPVTPSRHMTAWRKFKELWESLTFLDVFTDAEPHRRMLITEVTMPRRVAESRASRFSVLLKKPVITQTDLTDNLADTVVDSGSGEADLGTQGTADL